jgi:hypothetical protein
MKDVFFKDYVKITMPSPITEDFELLIGALNEPLQKNFGICICYDQDENGFSGFAITNQFHSETIFPEVKTSINVILDYLKQSEVDGWVDLKTQLKELLDKVEDEAVDFEEANNE